MFFYIIAVLTKKNQAIRLPMSIQGKVRLTGRIEITYIFRYNLIMKE